jgi:hypothetical protein
MSSVFLNRAEQGIKNRKKKQITKIIQQNLSKNYQSKLLNVSENSNLLSVRKEIF